ncbi:MAG: VapC toxin family PIN domain ribonuclease, partial [Alphaproteobacteria bacterium]
MTTEQLLLDTCAIIWSATGARLDPAAVDAIEAARQTGRRVGVSAITAWELGLLASRGRLPTAIAPLDLFD